MVHTGLHTALLKMPPGVLDVAIKAVMQGAATHVDPGVRRTCLQVWTDIGCGNAGRG